MNNLKYIPSRFYKTLLLLLIAIDFFGLIPFDFLTLKGLSIGEARKLTIKDVKKLYNNAKEKSL